MILKSGRYGPFYSCSGYPDCSNIRKIAKSGKVATPAEPTGVNCPECDEGELVQRFSRRGAFYSCNRYPKCKFAVSHRPIAKPCPECGGKDPGREGNQARRTHRSLSQQGVQLQGAPGRRSGGEVGTACGDPVAGGDVSVILS
jgi:ssDNA-binding Zn-finger/Zn-ribbon topoisomerase 1